MSPRSPVSERVRLFPETFVQWMNSMDAGSTSPFASFVNMTPTPSVGSPDTELSGMVRSESLIDAERVVEKLSGGVGRIPIALICLSLSFTVIRTVRISKVNYVTVE